MTSPPYCVDHTETRYLIFEKIKIRKFEASNRLFLSVTIAWQKPKSDGGAPITGYTIEKREKGTDRWLK